MTYQDFDLNARYELLNRAMNQDNTLDSEVQQSLHQLDYLVYHELVNLGQKTPTPNFAKFLFPLQEKFKQFKEFCEFPAITQKNIVAIGGKFSAGKSTFINNLLGKKRLAVEIDPTTSIPTYILKGEQNQIVGLNLFNRQVLFSQDEFATLTHEEKEKYGSQVGRLLKSVFITDPDFRWENLALLDTPGYTKPEDKQQSERTDADVAHAQLNSAQFIIWLVSAEDGGIKDDDLAFLASLNRNIPKLVLITKSDRKTPDEVKDIVHLTKQLLSNAGLAVKNVLPVSRKLSDYPLDDVLVILDKVNDKNQKIINFGEYFDNLFDSIKQLIIKEKDKYQNLINQTNKLVMSDKISDTVAKENIDSYKSMIKDFDNITQELDKYFEKFCCHCNTVIEKLNLALPTMSAWLWWCGLNDEWRFFFLKEILGLDLWKKYHSEFDKKYNYRKDFDWLNKDLTFGYVKKLQNLTHMECNSSFPKEVAPLARLTQLKELYVSWFCDVEDISFLIHLTRLQKIHLCSQKIRDISSLANLTQLPKLYLRGNEIRDISPLATLTNLESLNLEENQIQNISPLTNLTELTWLRLGNNQIQNISPLANLTQLTYLNLCDNQIRDISSLANLTQLPKLYLWGNEIRDISPLATLTNLESLSLGNNQIQDISPLANLTELTWLMLDDNQIQDISPLLNLKKLNALRLINNPIQDLSPLKNLTQLDTLSLTITKIQDIIFLESLTQLEDLSLAVREEIQDISLLTRLTQLTKLDIRQRKVKDITPLTNLKKLEELDLSSNQIYDITPLANLKKLEELNLSGNQIHDITPLAKLQEFKELDLSSNQIHDISPLRSVSTGFFIKLNLADNQIKDIYSCRFLFSRLCDINLSNNRIEDISAFLVDNFYNFYSLKRLFLANNQIQDISPLQGLTGLERLDLKGNPINPEKIKWLQEKLPNCKINFE